MTALSGHSQSNPWGNMTAKSKAIPSRRVAMVGAWTTAATILAVAWCMVGGVWLGVRLIVDIIAALF